MTKYYQAPSLASKLFEELATDTWTRLRDGELFAIPQGEVTITEHILLEIARARFPIITIDKTTVPREAEVGADWEWWIGTRSNNNWWRFAVQAKKLSPEHHSYKQLSHTILRRPPEKDEPQIDALERYAHKVKAIPLYALYNYYENVSVDHWHCQTQEYHTADKTQFGCTLASVETIRKAKILNRGKHKTFEKIHRESTGVPVPLPWSCLFHPQCMKGAMSGLTIVAHPLAGSNFSGIRSTALPAPLHKILENLEESRRKERPDIPLRLALDEILDYPPDNQYSPRLYPAYIVIIDIERWY